MQALTRRTIRIALVASVLTVAAVLPQVAARVSPGEPTVREIRLVVRDMSYRIGDSPEVNPTLRVHPGERVRFVLTNTDIGMVHDFVIQDFNVSTRLLKGLGSETVEFTVPDARGTHAYNCTPHSGLMRGTVTVE
jgi:plastocyanin